MKKLFALLLALIMVMSLATTAFAAETTGKIKNDTDRTYEAYRIFKGTQGDGAVLGDIEWGDGIDTSIIVELQDLVVNGDTPFADCESAADFASVLAQHNSYNSEIAKAFANLVATSTDVSTEVGPNEEVTLPSGYYLLIDVTQINEDHPTLNPAMMQVTNGNTYNIVDKNGGPPSFDKDLEDGTDATTAEIGESVTFVLSAKMPSNFDGYDFYTVIFHDTLSKGLTFNNDIEVSVTGFTPTYKVNADGTTTITITSDNVLDVVNPGDTITVTYSATVNSEADTGTPGNPNEAYLEYSNNPNNESDYGQTPPDTVVVFTFTMDVTKVDGDDRDTELAGAEFVLLNSAKDKVATVVNGVLTGWVNLPAEGAAWPENTVQIAEQGRFDIKGLDAGTYYLRETKAPAGYNLLKDDITIEIIPTITNTEETQALTELKVKVNGSEGTCDLEHGSVFAIVENFAGATLPETGGMGTTLFYVFGGIMMLGALVLLVTKKRMADAV